VQLIHGDCLEKMKDIPDQSIDMVLCDLPYGTTSMEWDNTLPLDQLWPHYRRVCKGNIVLFASQPFTTDLINSNRSWFRYALVWNKNVPTGMSQAKYRPMKYHEDIVIFYHKKTTYNPIRKPRVGKGKECYNYDHYCGASNHVTYEKVKKRYDPNFVHPSTILSFNVVPNRNGKLHPTEKPIELLEYLIKTYSNEGETVLDNTMGSGSTGVACKNLNRDFIGIEKDETYFNIAKKRIEEV
jgi:site-specific DNA-methyltransferase (adenine-specific)